MIQAKKVVMVLLVMAVPMLIYAQETITGTVTDSQSSETLPGVNILVKGTSTGASTDADGRFKLRVPSLQDTLVVSYIGYQTNEVPINGRMELGITLQPQAIAGEELVVVGYGTQKKENLTGSVTSISGAELEESPTTNITDAIGGRLSGVITVKSDGRPGSGSNIQVRGLSTLNNNEPLVVVDGVVRTDGFGNINPAAVEDITVLKDASAAAVYGARAANGVILITTKRGEKGKPSITYNGTIGTQQPTQYPDLMSAYEYATARNEALLNQGYNPSNPSQAGLFYSDNELSRFKKGEGTTDWYEETFNNNSLMMEHTLSVNGGTEAVRYFALLGYLSEDGMYDNINFNRVNFRANIDTKINDNLTVKFNLEGRQERDQNPSWSASSIFGYVVRVRPTVPAYHDDGLPYNTAGEHPVEMIHNSGYADNKDNIYQGALSFEQELPFISDNLTLSGKASYFKRNEFDKQFFTPYTMYDENDAGEITNRKVVGGQTSLSENFGETQNISLNVSLNYSETLNKHDISGLLLAEQYKSEGNIFSAYKEDFQTNIKDEFFASGPNNQSIGGSGVLNDLRRSLVGRFNYGFDSRYLIEGTFRLDGSYRFPEDSRYGFFPAVSAGWRISEESFFEKLTALNFINNLKLRVSRGMIGNDRVAPFQFTDSYGITTDQGPIIGGQPKSFVAYGVYPNQSITWEKQINNNIGVDATLFDEKLGVEFNYFLRNTKDILWSRERSIPGTFGRNLPDENYAEVKSQGFEFTLTHNNNINEDFSYNFRLIGSYATNEVTRIDDPANALDYQKQLGKSIGYRAGYKTLGIFRSQEEADDWYGGTQFGNPSLAGDLKYADLNDNGEIDLQDQTVLAEYGNTPRIMYGFSGGLNWRNINLNFLIQGAAKRNLFLSGSGRVMYRGGGSNNNFEYLQDSWSKENVDAKYPLAWVDRRPMNDRNSSFWLRNAGYARLKSVNIGYGFSSGWLQKYNMQELRLTVSGYNLFTWSSLKVFDPEAGTGTGSYYPQQRSYKIGVSISF